MANYTPVIRTEAQEIQRQISFTKTLRNREIEKSNQKVANYNEKIADLEAKLAKAS